VADLQGQLERERRGARALAAEKGAAEERLAAAQVCVGGWVGVVCVLYICVNVCACVYLHVCVLWS
jgi:hypothetical protein